MNPIGPLFSDHKLPPFDPLAHFCHRDQQIYLIGELHVH